MYSEQVANILIFLLNCFEISNKTQNALFCLDTKTSFEKLVLKIEFDF